MSIELTSVRRGPRLAITVYLLGMGLVLLASCSNRVKLARLEGRVTFMGEPVSSGAMIIFENPEHATYITSKLNENGEYRVEMAEGYGLPPGDYQVVVVPPPIIMSAEFVAKHREGPPPELVMFPRIPLRYRDPATSGLRLSLPPKGTVYNVDMQP